MTVVVAFTRLLVEGRFAEGDRRQVVVPGAVTSSSMPCPINMQREPGADPIEVGRMTMLVRQAAEFRVQDTPDGRYGMVVWIWAGTGEIRGRSLDEVECLVRDYRPQGWIHGSYIPREEGHFMVEGTIVGVMLIRNHRPGDPGWRIIDQATADGWASGSFPVQGWDPS